MQLFCFANIGKLAKSFFEVLEKNRPANDKERFSPKHRVLQVSRNKLPTKTQSLQRFLFVFPKALQEHIVVCCLVFIAKILTSYRRK
jgi:hypothetical protein